MGRSFTMSQFFQVWEGLFAFLDARNRPATPTPFMYSASVFTVLFVKGSREQRDLKFITPDPRFYLHWWHIQYQTLQTEAPALRFGTKAWMQGLL